MRPSWLFRNHCPSGHERRRPSFPSPSALSALRSAAMHTASLMAIGINRYHLSASSTLHSLVFGTHAPDRGRRRSGSAHSVVVGNQSSSSIDSDLPAIHTHHPIRFVTKSAHNFLAGKRLH